MGRKNHIRSVSITVHGQAGGLATCTWSRWGLIEGSHSSGDPGKPMVHVERKRLKLNELHQMRKLLNVVEKQLDIVCPVRIGEDQNGKSSEELLFTFSGNQSITIALQPGYLHSNFTIQDLINFLMGHHAGGW